MIIKKITPKDIGRAVGFELMKLRWEYGLRIRQVTHLAGVDIKRIDAAEIGRFAGWKHLQRLLKLYDVDINIELVHRNPNSNPIHKID